MATATLLTNHILGVLAPPLLPKDIVAGIHSALTSAVHSAEMKPVYASIGTEPPTSSLADFAAFLTSEVSKLGKAVE